MDLGKCPNLSRIVSVKQFPALFLISVQYQIGRISQVQEHDPGLKILSYDVLWMVFRLEIPLIWQQRTFK